MSRNSTNAGDLSVGELCVNGDIIVSGNVDGVDISDLKLIVDTNSTDIFALQQDVDTNASNILTNENNIVIREPVAE